MMNNNNTYSIPAPGQSIHLSFRRSLRAAHLVVVDTQVNQSYRQLHALFQQDQVAQCGTIWMYKNVCKQHTHTLWYWFWKHVHFSFCENCVIFEKKRENRKSEMKTDIFTSSSCIERTPLAAHSRCTSYPNQIQSLHWLPWFHRPWWCLKVRHKSQILVSKIYLSLHNPT